MKMGFGVRKMPYNGPLSPRDRCMEKKLFRGAKPELTGVLLIREGQIHGMGVPQAVPRSYTAVVLHPRGSCVPSPCRIEGLGFL